MADEDDSQKTEDPTDRKLSKARDKGQVGVSQEVKNWGVLLGSAAMLALMAPWMMERTLIFNQGILSHVEDVNVSLGMISGFMAEILIEMGITVAPAFATLIVLAIVASVAQTGFLVAPSKLMPQVSNISVMKGVKRMFSARSLVEFLKGLFKLTVIGTISFFMAVPWMTDVTLMPDMDLLLILDRIYVVSLSISAGALFVMFVVSVIDFAYQKFEFTKSMKMSRQEIKDEHKDTEGDPQIKARIRKLRMERAQQRMMSNIPNADVVVTNPTHYAVALEYKMDAMGAPKLVAKGVDSLAFRIREVAEEHDVPIVENPPLARALYAAVEIDEEIPVEHYQAVAEVIGYVMGLKGNGPGGGGQTIN
ncbi:flagellar biosynthesis protein FlhB [Magnetovibrio sp. PR-2]|uniref:flagellar biosynthesis protein FlhB n=1 Tax=Magnetovibrio sp. PR-2 TaxID=3120356 RepID=UPI002FCE1902